MAMRANETCSLLACRLITGITNNLLRQGNATITAHTRASFEERQSKSFGCNPSQRTCQRSSQAASARRWTGKGSPRTFAFAKSRKKSRVSPDHRSRLHTPVPPDVLPQTGPTALGNVSPSVSWLSPKKPRPPSCSVAGGHHHVGEETPWWCRWPAGLHGAAADHQRQPPNVLYRGGPEEECPSRGASRLWTPWHPLPCRQPNTPTCAQAARW